MFFRKRWKLIFLVKHAKGPKMSVESEAKFLNHSRGWAKKKFEQKYEKFCNVDFSYERAPKRVMTKKQDHEIVKLSTAVFTADCAQVDS